MADLIPEVRIIVQLKDHIRELEALLREWDRLFGNCVLGQKTRDALYWGDEHG